MPVEIRPIASGELTQVASLVEAAFAGGIAHYFSDAGRETFRSLTTVRKFRTRLACNSRAWVAAAERGEIVGYLELTGDHVRMLFIRPDRQRRGIGRRLLEHVLDQRANRDITVNSAPNSDGFYLRMGFEPAGPRKEESGIVFTPMIRRADQALQAPRQQGSALRR